MNSILILRGGTMANNTLSLCIIAKNEANNIARCIGSCEHVVDEVIVVDTGSTDYTAKIAKGLGAKVIDFPWQNDFALARNKALEHATMDWIIYLDCDEMLDFKDGFVLKELLENEDKEAYTLLLCNVVDGKKSMACQSLRVLRNREQYRFKGRIHEQIYPVIEANKGRDSVEVTQVKFYHYGYDENFASMAEKSKRNLEIFKNYPEEEKDGFYYYNLANEYSRIGDAEQSTTYYKKSMEVGGYDTGYKIFLPVYLVKGLHSMGRNEEACYYGEECLKEFETYKDMHFLMLACYYELKDYHKAKMHLHKYLEYSKADYGYPEFNMNVDNDIPKLLQELEALTQ